MCLNWKIRQGPIFIKREQDKSSDIEQQPHFGDRKVQYIFVQLFQIRDDRRNKYAI